MDHKHRRVQDKVELGLKLVDDRFLGNDDKVVGSLVRPGKESPGDSSGRRGRLGVIVAGGESAWREQCEQSQESTYSIGNT